MSWTVEGGGALNGVVLAGYECSPEYGRSRGPLVEALSPWDIAEVFGMANPGRSALQWKWDDKRYGEEVDEDALSKAFLLSTVFAARVPLVEVRYLIGKELTREGLAARSFLLRIDFSSVVETQVQTEAPSMTIEEVASALQITRGAAYKRLQRGEIPGRMPGRTIRISRERFMTWLRAGGRK